METFFFFNVHTHPLNIYTHFSKNKLQLQLQFCLFFSLFFLPIHWFQTFTAAIRSHFLSFSLTRKENKNQNGNWKIWVSNVTPIWGLPALLSRVLRCSLCFGCLWTGFVLAIQEGFAFGRFQNLLRSLHLRLSAPIIPFEDRPRYTL